VLERLWETLSNGATDDVHIGSRFARLAAVAAPASAVSAQPESAIRAQFSAVPLSNAPAWVMPAVGELDVQRASDSAAPVPADTAAADHDALLGDAAARGATVILDGVPQLQFGTAAASSLSTLSARNDAANYVVHYSDDFQSAYVMNSATKTLLTGAPGDWPELGQGDDDVLVLSGDYSTGFTLPSQPHDIDRVVVTGTDNYNLVSTDDQVGPGQIMAIDAMALGAGNHILFDGSAETDGRFYFYGSEAGDIFIGGAGNDRIAGLGGADMLAGGGGSDIFVYTGAGESTGTNYDTLGGFDATSDKIDLLGTVTGFHAPIEGGTLSLATFNADLSAALGGLGASQAAWFAPDAGELAGQIFLIVDANGVAGYQEGEDYVFAVTGAPLADLSGHTDIFV
jgi:Ca2+-binding RTX toxin-like protein